MIAGAKELNYANKRFSILAEARSSFRLKLSLGGCLYQDPAPGVMQRQKEFVYTLKLFQ